MPCGYALNLVVNNAEFMHVPVGDINLNFWLKD